MILFAVMTNNLLRGWHLRIKFVDDTTALEILPLRNGISLLNVAVNGIHKFSIEHSTKLNPKKCKEVLKNLDKGLPVFTCHTSIKTVNAQTDSPRLHE